MSVVIKPLYATSDVARICNVSHDVVKKWCRKKLISFYRLSNGYLGFDEDMLAEIKVWSAGRRQGRPVGFKPKNKRSVE